MTKDSKETSKPLSKGGDETKATAKEKVTPIDTTTVKYWHEGKLGMIAFDKGKDNKGEPVNEFIYFRDHVYETSDTKLIKQLDNYCEANPHIAKRLDVYEEMLNSQPANVVMDINGKKVSVPMEALTDAFKEQLAKEQANRGEQTLVRGVITS